MNKEQSNELKAQPYDKKLLNDTKKTLSPSMSISIIELLQNLQEYVVIDSKMEFSEQGI